eukprot:TRINITY_DN11669_c0_g1_i1.p1 TRINITY_DN11669_c0_g1~~TRINITY_DN11669_c0_g1_i1.p1  ORF type:complete len:472 (+),score=69.77 TRINITY_DN11669_c0_g1_i1:435-1850(+)
MLGESGQASEPLAGESSNLLIAYMLRGRTRELPIDYTQGMSFLVALLLIVTKSDTESSFWLFVFLVEQVLPADFFSPTPPLVGYHAANAVLTQLVYTHFPDLLQRLGEDQLGSSVRLLSVKWFVTCFVDYLPQAPLLELWDRLLSAGPPTPRRLGNKFQSGPLLSYGLALVATNQKELLKDPNLDATCLYSALLTAGANMDAKQLAGFKKSVAKFEKSIDLTAASRAYEDALIGMRREAYVEMLGSQSSHFSPAELRQMHREFTHLSKDGAGVDCTTLDRVARTVDPEWPTEHSTQLFDRLRKDPVSGQVEFLELMTALSTMTRGTVDEKLRLCFQLYQEPDRHHCDSDGYIGTAGILEMSTRLFHLSLSRHGTDQDVRRATTVSEWAPSDTVGRSPDSVLSASLAFDTRLTPPKTRARAGSEIRRHSFAAQIEANKRPGPLACLLYTSDAADEEDSVDLGGRRIIKQKKE